MVFPKSKIGVAETTPNWSRGNFDSVLGYFEIF